MKKLIYFFVGVVVGVAIYALYIHDKIQREAIDRLSAQLKDCGGQVRDCGSRVEKLSVSKEQILAENERLSDEVSVMESIFQMENKPDEPKKKGNSIGYHRDRTQDEV